MTDTNTPEEGWRPIEAETLRPGDEVLVAAVVSEIRGSSARVMPESFCLDRGQWTVPRFVRRTPPEPTEPPFAAAKRGALPGQLRETKSSSEPALSELVDRAVAAVNGRFHDWTPTPAMLGYARAVARQALTLPPKDESDQKTGGSEP